MGAVIEAGFEGEGSGRKVGLRDSAVGRWAERRRDRAGSFAACDAN